MLVFSRRSDESIMIGDNIKITVVSIREGKVNIGIDAPREIPVHRNEVYEAMKQEEEALIQIGREAKQLLSFLKSDPKYDRLVTLIDACK